MNLIKYLGGIEAIEYAVETNIRQIMFGEDFGFQLKRDTIFFQIVGRHPRRVELPTTDQRVPDFYRHMADGRGAGEWLDVIGYCGIAIGYKEFCQYREEQKQLILYDHHDPTLLQITSRVIVRLMKEAGVTVNVVTEHVNAQKVQYNISEPKTRYVVGQVGPDETYANKARHYLEAFLNRTTRRSIPSHFASLVEKLIFCPAAQRDFIKQEARLKLKSEQDRKTWFAIERILKPYLGNTRRTQPVPSAEQGPDTDNFWDWLKFYSNHGDGPLNESANFASNEIAKRQKARAMLEQQARMRELQQAQRVNISNMSETIMGYSVGNDIFFL